MTETEADEKFAIAKRLGLLTDREIEVVVTEESRTNEPPSDIAIRKGFLARNQLDLISACADPLNVVPGYSCLLYTSPSPRDATLSRMPSSA